MTIYSPEILAEWNRALDDVQIRIQAMETRGEDDIAVINRESSKAHQIVSEFINLSPLPANPTEMARELDRRVIDANAVEVMKRANALTDRAFELCRKANESRRILLFHRIRADRPSIR